MAWFGNAPRDNRISHEEQVQLEWDDLAAQSPISRDAISMLREIVIDGPPRHSLDPMGNIITLDLTARRLHPAALSAIDKLKKLSKLSLAFCDIPQVGLPTLHHLTKLEWLSFQGSSVKSSDFEGMAAMLPVKYLSLLRTTTTDDCIIHLPEMPNLEHLVLSLTPLSDVGLLRLTRFDSLQILDVRYTNVTEIGIANFQLRLPNCKVKRRAIRSPDGRALP